MNKMYLYENVESILNNFKSSKKNYKLWKNLFWVTANKESFTKPTILVGAHIKLC